jgi:hypothetical protein
MAEVLAVAAEFFVKSTSTAPTGTDKLGKATTVSLSWTPTMVPTTYLGQGHNYETEAPTTTKFTATAEGNLDFGDAPQQLLVQAAVNRTLVYLSVYDNADAAASAHKGWTFPVYVNSREHNFEPTAFTPFNFSLSLGGAPTEIIAS